VHNIMMYVQRAVVSRIVLSNKREREKMPVCLSRLLLGLDHCFIALNNDLYNIHFVFDVIQVFGSQE